MMSSGGGSGVRPSGSYILLGCAVLFVSVLSWQLLRPLERSVRAAESLLSRQGFAGSAACAQCHPAIHASHAGTAMRAALLRPESDLALATKGAMKGNVGAAAYTITPAAGGAYTYGVRFHGQQLEAPIRWAFGLGSAGQTYILEHQGALYESRVSFYDSIKALDLTIGAANAAPTKLIDAAGRKMSEADIRECFDCHALGVPRTGKPSLEGIELGVGCENCHGPAAMHVAARRGSDLKSGRMQPLRNQEAEEISQLCGRCHRTWEDVVSLRIRGVNNVRFQPYRLTLSRCYDSREQRISCVACHNPHENVVTDAASYDRQCQSCHAARAPEPKPASLACKSGKTANCTSCHMPKRELPGAHRAFTDHYIRVHRPGESYPDL